MENKEFRIGNFVFVGKSASDISMILNAFSKAVIEASERFDRITAIDEVKGIKIASCTDFIDYKQVKGIPITKSFLLSFGFTEFRDTLKFTKDTGLIYKRGGEQFGKKLTIKLTKAGNWRVENFANQSIYLKYVHELQNLYYVFAGKCLSMN